MRLRDIIQILDEYSKDVSLTVSGIPNDNSNRKVVGVRSLKVAIHSIEKTGVFDKEISELKEIEGLFKSTQDSVALPVRECDKAVKWLGNFRRKINVVNTVLNSILPEQDKNSICLKLPKINNLKELSNVASKLDKIFDQMLVNPYIEGETKLQNFDTGSEWIEVVFNTGKALGVVVSVIYASILLKREHIKNQELLEVVKNRKITNDIYQNLSEELLNKSRQMLDEEAIKIANQAGVKDSDKEYSRRIKYCINEISELIDKGLKFFPSSKSPSEIETKLPDFSKNSVEEMLSDVKRLPEETTNNLN